MVKGIKSNERRYETEQSVNITTEMIKKQVKKIPNWKSPGPDGV